MKKKLLTLLIISGCWHSVYAAEFTYQVNGITGAAATNVQARLDDALSKASPKKDFNSAQVQELYQKASKQISKALLPYGYFQPQITTQLQTTTKGWHAIYQIDPGPVLRIKRLDINVIGEGKNDPVIEKFFRRFPLQAGQPFITPDYNAAKQKIFTIVERQGYITATLDQHTVDINLKKYTSVIHLTLNTGPRYYFGPITFSKTPLADHFIAKFAPFKPGDPYSSDKVAAFQDALNNSNYFQQVWIEPQRDQATNNTVPIKANLAARPAQQYTFGAGFGTDTGPRGTLGYELRHVTDTGQRFSALSSVSAVQSSLQTLYTIPGRNPVNDQYNISGSLLDAHAKQGTSFTKQLGVAEVNNKNSWQRTISLNFQDEDFKLEGQRSAASHLLIPGISWTKLDAKDPVFTKNGNRFSVRFQGAKQGWLTSTSFLQGEVQDKFIHSFADHSRFVTRGDVGYTAVQNLPDFPLSQRFSAGGSQSVRGYSYQALGPGKYLIVGSVEYQYPFKEKWYGTVFYDAGNAMNHMNDTLQRGPGVGGLWRSPVGPMELTLAKAVSRPGQPFKIQFTMGPDLG